MRYCPMCGASKSQMFMGRWGPDAVMRCGICGIQYYRDIDDDPVISMSEWGSYRYDGDTDMKVLRKRAEGAVRYFNKGGKPRVDMHTHVFGYPFSIIDNGKLVDKDNAYKGNVIIRALSYGGGIYEGKVTLSYNDDYNDGRGQGGSGCILIGDVKDVRIENGFLVISGTNLNKPIEFRYRIQERPDEKKIVFPIPKGGRVPEEKPVPRKQPTIEDYGTPPKPLKCGPDTRINDWLTAKGLRPVEHDMTFHRLYVATYVDLKPIGDVVGECNGRVSELIRGISEAMGVPESSIRKAIEGSKPKTQTPVPKKESPKPAPKPEPKPTPKAEPKPAPKRPAPRKKGEQVFEVRVDGAVMGSFSSKAKAESLKRQLKAEGKKAKIVGVFC